MTWICRINRALDEGHVTLEDEARTHDWRTCAVGEALGLQSTDMVNTVYFVKDLYLGQEDPLYQLGMEFQKIILNNDLGKVLAIYYKIRNCAIETKSGRGHCPVFCPCRRNER